MTYLLTRGIAPHRPGQFRAPTRPDAVLPERRDPVMVDTMRNPRPLSGLDARERALFDAQLRAYRLSCELAALAGVTAKYGGAVPPDLIERWRDAVDSWRALRSVSSARLTKEI